MDYKQKKIFERILDDNNLSEKNVFIQHRNLKEFSSFVIERINPTHRIMLYGKLRRHLVKDNHYEKIVCVGEILIYGSFCIFPFNSFSLSFINALVIWLFISKLVLEKKMEKFLYAYSNRREYRKRKDALHG